jgi:hypothetical protein
MYGEYAERTVFLESSVTVMLYSHKMRCGARSWGNRHVVEREGTKRAIICSRRNATTHSKHSKRVREMLVDWWMDAKWLEGEIGTLP